MKTVGDLISIGFPLLWHEGVAIVQEVASQISTGHGVPADRDLSFNEDGTLTVPVVSPGLVPVVTALGRLLERLLPADAPIALCALASENSGDQPTHPTVDAFTKALAFFERPGRAAHLLGVATRLQQYTPPASTEEELERLRKKVIDAPEEPPVAAPVARRAFHPAYAAVGALAIVGVIASARLPVGPLLKALSNVSIPILGRSSTAAAASSTTADSTPTPDAAADVVKGDTNLPAPHRLTVNRRQSVPHRVVPDIRSVVVASVDAPYFAPALPDATDATGAEPSGVTPTAGLGALDREAPPRVDRPKIYSSEDTGVTPAALVRPQFPSEPTPGPNTGLFDLTVDESGNVVSVRLVSPAGRFQERALVSAAKAWRFRPALLEGHPVKYRLRVPINVPEQQ